MNAAPRLSRVQQQEQTRQALLDAAAEVVAQHGLDGASIDAITAAAGYSRGAFYSNFSDRVELLVALMDRQLTRIAEGRLSSLLDAPEEQRLARAARWLTADDPPLEVLLIVELARQRQRHPERVEELDGAVSKVLETLAGLLDQQHPSTAAPLPAAERDARVRAVLAAVLGADLLRHLGVPATPRTLEVLLAGLVPEEPSR